jgi:fructose-1-phosphate kinase PfkB-like protein
MSALWCVGVLACRRVVHVAVAGALAHLGIALRLGGTKGDGLVPTLSYQENVGPGITVNKATRVNVNVLDAGDPTPKRVCNTLP